MEFTRNISSVLSALPDDDTAMELTQNHSAIQGAWEFLQDDIPDTEPVQPTYDFANLDSAPLVSGVQESETNAAACSEDIVHFTGDREALNESELTMDFTKNLSVIQAVKAPVAESRCLADMSEVDNDDFGEVTMEFTRNHSNLIEKNQIEDQSKEITGPVETQAQQEQGMEFTQNHSKIQRAIDFNVAPAHETFENSQDLQQSMEITRNHSSIRPAVALDVTTESMDQSMEMTRNHSIVHPNRFALLEPDASMAETDGEHTMDFTRNFSVIQHVIPEQPKPMQKVPAVVTPIGIDADQSMNLSENSMDMSDQSMEMTQNVSNVVHKVRLFFIFSVFCQG